jgi:glycosyltransferase involved in cell wall biosynthesis
MSDLPSISLVTPTLNQAGTLRETLDSICAQDVLPHEHLIYDALSTDATADILGEYAETLPWMRLTREADEGQSDAIDKGIRAASGEIVGWLNSDDYLHPGALRIVGETFAKHPEAPLVYGGGCKVDRAGNLIKRVRPLPYDYGLLARAFYFLQPAMFFRRDTYLKVGGLDRSLEFAMDWDLVLKLATQGDFVAVDADLASLRCYEGTKSCGGGWKRAREIAGIGRRHNGFFDPNNLVFVAKSLLGLVPFESFRRRVDGGIHMLYGKPGPMVEGWPK